MMGDYDAGYGDGWDKGYDEARLLDKHRAVRIRELEAEVAELKCDKARLDFIENNVKDDYTHWCVIVSDEDGWVEIDRVMGSHDPAYSELRVAIDAAIKVEMKEEGGYIGPVNNMTPDDVKRSMKSIAVKALASGAASGDCEVDNDG